MSESDITQTSTLEEILQGCQKLLGQYESERAITSTRHLDLILGSSFEVSVAEPISNDAAVTDAIDFPEIQSSGFAAAEREQLRTVASELTWFHSSRSHCAYAQIVGPEAPIRHAEFRVGLFLLPPNTHYAQHVHVAEEIYVLIAGTGSWSLGDATFQQHTEGDLVDVASMVPHALKTEKSAVLTLYTWTGLDVSFDDYRYCE